MVTHQQHSRARHSGHANHAPQSKKQEGSQAEQKPKPDTHKGQPKRHEYSRVQALLAEAVGTFALAFVAAGSAVMVQFSHGKISEVAALVAPGVLVMALIYALGDVSGAHVNPAVTLAFALRGVFPWRSALEYWAAQFVGAILGGLLLHALFGGTAAAGITLPKGGVDQAVVLEIIATFLLALVILATADGSHLVGHNAGIAVGGTIALDGILAGPISGASMNPARSLGPALAMGLLGNQWIYVLAPCVGAALAVLIVWLTRGAPPQKAEEKATGDGRMEK